MRIRKACLKERPQSLMGLRWGKCQGCLRSQATKFERNIYIACAYVPLHPRPSFYVHEKRVIVQLISFCWFLISYCPCSQIKASWALYGNILESQLDIYQKESKQDCTSKTPTMESRPTCDGCLPAAPQVKEFNACFKPSFATRFAFYCKREPSRLFYSTSMKMYSMSHK